MNATAARTLDSLSALPAEGIDLHAVLAELEDRLIREALERAQNNRTVAARLLGINRSTFHEKLRRMRARVAARTAKNVVEVAFR
jgi:DNA-binding NtrC family response regulator